MNFFNIMTPISNVAKSNDVLIKDHIETQMVCNGSLY